jgi:hypothetical protein
MKISKIVLAIVTLFFVSLVQANIERNYWQEIRNILEDSNSRKYREYFNELSADELIIAGRQCSKELQEITKPEDWDMVGSMALSFFYENYPTKTNSLEDISPLINELKDKTQLPFWRRMLLHILGGSWSSNLNVQNRISTAKIMYEIYSDDSENVLLKPKAIRKSTELLISVYAVNLKNDPNAAIKANEKVLAEINRSIKAQISMFSDKSTDPAIQESIIVSWARYHKHNLTPPQVSQTLAEAVDNYKNYDERLWKLLVRTNIRSFANRAAEAKLQNMIDEAKDETNKRSLIFTKEELDKEANKEK